jgi:hypothetical protein
MQLDIQEFLDRVEPHSYSESELATTIVREIRKAEDFKISLMEDVEVHPDFVVAVTEKIDTYVFQLQELEKRFSAGLIPLDQQTALSDEDIRKRMAAHIDTLRQFALKKGGR